LCASRGQHVQSNVSSRSRVSQIVCICQHEALDRVGSVADQGGNAARQQEGAADETVVDGLVLRVEDDSTCGGVATVRPRDVTICSTVQQNTVRADKLLKDLYCLKVHQISDRIFIDIYNIADK